MSFLGIAWEDFRCIPGSKSLESGVVRRRWHDRFCWERKSGMAKTNTSVHESKSSFYMRLNAGSQSIEAFKFAVGAASSNSQDMQAVIGTLNKKDAPELI